MAADEPEIAWELERHSHIHGNLEIAHARLISQGFAEEADESFGH